MPGTCTVPFPEVTEAERTPMDSETLKVMHAVVVEECYKDACRHVVVPVISTSRKTNVLAPPGKQNGSTRDVTDRRGWPRY